MQKWNSDTMLCALFGEEWCTEMELHNDASNADNVRSANAWLAAQGHTGKVVLACREAAGGDELEWLCNFAIAVA
jgi:hypothetical protein